MKITDDHFIKTRRRGSFSYDEKEDAPRVDVKPATAEFREALAYTFDDIAESAAATLRWDKLAVFTFPWMLRRLPSAAYEPTEEHGDFHGPTMTKLQHGVWTAIAAWSRR
jgi:hypothetical protein